MRRLVVHNLPCEQGDRIANYLTMLGHICSDINQGALSAVLPFLLLAHPDYTYASVTMLIFASSITSAIIQPLFGYIGDKWPTPWLMSAGIFLAGLGMFGIGYSESYWMVVSSAMVSGIGVAMFHPEGGRLANLAAGERKASGMSIFAVGGNIGFFIGPVLAAVFLSTFGMHGTVAFLVPSAACAIVLLAFNRRFVALGVRQEVASAAGKTMPDDWGRFCLVLVCLSLRAIVQYGLLAFMPLFVLDVLGQSESVSSLAISAFAVFGAIATILSGRTSEKYGAIRLQKACFLGMALLIVAFALSQSVVASFCFAMPLAVASSLFYASTVAYGMDCVPNSLGMASGLSYGVVICIGGAAEPFLGMAADFVGIVPILFALAAVCIVGFFFSFTLRPLYREEDSSALST